MTLQEQLAFIKEQTIRMNAFNFAGSLIGWDSATGNPPKNGLDKKSQYSGILAGESYRLLTADAFKSAVWAADAAKDQLETPEQKAMIREWKKTIERMEKIPEAEYTAYVELISRTEILWEDAKNANDFESFVPYYEQIFEYQRRFAEYYGYEGHPYNALLEDYEPGMTVELLDRFFSELREEIVPLLKRIMEKRSAEAEDYGFMNREMPVEAQRAFSKRLLEIIGFDLESGKLAESEHPFTNALSLRDVRLTTHYKSNELASAIFSTLHEGGHGIYEQKQAPELEDLGLTGGASAAVHESQSRMYENVFGRSLEFWSCYYPELQAACPGLMDEIPLELFCRAVNQVTPSLIRTEADELTYALHVMVRYEIEKGLLEGSIQAADLAKLWKEKMKTYLGIEPPTDTLGVLQDVHWSCGLVGYFPSYALGNAYAAQLLRQMRQEIDVFEGLAAGNFEDINDWLEQKIHRYGQVYSPDQLMVMATGEPFNPEYYVEYLKDKFCGIYNVPRD